MAETLIIENAELTEAEFCKIRKLVYKHCGINLHEGKRTLIRSRLIKQLRQGNFNSFSEYIKHVLQDESGKEFSILIDSLSTNLTSFFREKQHFDFLRDTFLPNLLEQKQKTSYFKIRAWSAGCSSGEEPYSLAITLLDMVHGLGRWDIKLLATDISTRILKSAKKGLFDKERISPVSQMQKQKYLSMRNIDGKKMFEVNKNLRDVVIFKYLNLMNEWPIKPSGSGLDFIFCRNVMIYFDKSTQMNLINRFWNLLDHGGMLFTGHSESLTGIEHKFNYVQPTIYRKP